MKTIISTLLLICTLFFQNTIWSQNTDELEGYRYKVLAVNTTSVNETLPLIIGLHWMRSNPDEFLTFLKDIKSPARILLLEGNYPFKEGFSFYPTEPENYYKMNADGKLKVLTEEGNKLARFIASATKKYPSAKKPVIIGASQGGDLSYFIAIQHGDLIGLSCPLLATIDNRLITDNKSDAVSIHAFHGEEDPIVPLKTTLEHIELLKKHHFEAKIKTYKGVQHDISDTMKADFTALIEAYFKN